MSPSHMLNCQASLGVFFKDKTFLDLGVFLENWTWCEPLFAKSPQLEQGVLSAVPMGPCPQAECQAGKFNPADSRTPSPWNFSILFVKLGQLLCCPLRISRSVYFWWWVEKTSFHKCSPYLEAHGECPQFISMEIWVHLIKMRIKMWFFWKILGKRGARSSDKHSVFFWFLKMFRFRTGTEVLKPWDHLKGGKSQFLP